jgi:hypothetical protein
MQTSLLFLGLFLVGIQPSLPELGIRNSHGILFAESCARILDVPAASRTLESVAEALGIPLPRAETPVLEPRLGFWNRLRSLWGRCWALSRGRPGR